jgi:formylglycine-generating enzyme required for sulfatase activity
VAVIEKSKDGVTPLRLPDDHLRRSGYRLPTEAEWECACRAGTQTSRSYGSSVELLANNAWYNANAQNRTWPVGQIRPNDLGLFDMHGNVWSWCQESGWAYPPGTRERPARDEEDRRDITDALRRVMRGGAFLTNASLVRSAQRRNLKPGVRYVTAGMRVARTLR